MDWGSHQLHMGILELELSMNALRYRCHVENLLAHVSFRRGNCMPFDVNQMR